MADIFDDELVDDGNKQVEEPVKTPEVKQELGFEIPEKLRGKSPEDLAKMYLEAEKLIGKHAQEVGEVRKLADELIKQQLAPKEVKPAVEEEVDFFADPKVAVSKAVEKHPDVVAAKQAASQLKQMQAQQRLLNKHPDAPGIVSSAEFAEWVKASPARLRLYQMAESTFDADLADELLGTFKELRTVKSQQNKQDGDAVRNQNLKAAAVDTGGTGEAPKKIYRRADLIRLRMEDPDRYQQLGPEIRAAYAEGRVK